MTTQEKAKQLYRDAYTRWCYEISNEKNVASAKNAAEYVCNQILGLDVLTESEIKFWNEVKEEIYKIKA